MLADGRLTHDALYEELLAKLHADTIDLVVDACIDACHAEAILRPRDLRAASTETPPQDLGANLAEHKLARFAHVGAIIASTSAEQTQEWDEFRSGVFTHEVLSALRGAADIDGDHRIEYSELAAFLSAANRNIVDPRARPTTLIRAPQRQPRAPLVDLSAAPGTAALVGRPSALGLLYVEDARGNRLASFNAEPAHRVRLLVPAGIDLFVRAKTGEAEVQLAAGESLDLDRLVFSALAVRSRGAVEQSLRNGLFASRFGPSYYCGFMDRNEDLVTLAMPRPELVPSSRGATATPASAKVAWGAAASLAVTSGVFGGLAWQARHAALNGVEIDAHAAAPRHPIYSGASIAAISGAVVASVLGYLLSRP